MAPENDQPPESGRNGQPREGTYNMNGGKGKEKSNASISERLQRSANMALDSLSSSQAQLESASHEPKGSQARTQERARLNRTIGETSMSSQRHGKPGASLRAEKENQATEASFQDFQQQSSLGKASHATLRPGQSIGQLEAADGDAVMRLLDEPPSDSGMLNVFTPPEGQDLAIMTHERDRLRKALFREPEHSAPWATLLDPTYDLLPPLHELGSNEMLFGTEEADTARQHWLDLWRDVLTSYTDEVWGDLGPLASEAQAEVKQASEETGCRQSPDLQALNRLRMVLAHLRG